MSSYAPLEFSTTNVVPFPVNKTVVVETTTTPLPGFGGADLGTLIAALEALGQRAVTEREIISRASPFDALYISALEPDRVSRQVYVRIRQFSAIEDRSHEISFDDGLD